MSSSQFLVTVGVLIALFLIIYCRITGKGIGDVISELRESTGDRVEEVDIR